MPMMVVMGAPIAILVLLILLHFLRFLIEVHSWSMIEAHLQIIVEAEVVVGVTDVGSQEGVVVDHPTLVEGVVVDHPNLVEEVVADHPTLVVVDLDSVMVEVEVEVEV
jgi:hypothetical protein